MNKPLFANVLFIFIFIFIISCNEGKENDPTADGRIRPPKEVAKTAVPTEAISKFENVTL